MTPWLVAAGIGIGVPLALLAVAIILPCEGCRLRRERIGRAIEKLRARETGAD